MHVCVWTGVPISYEDLTHPHPSYVWDVRPDEISWDNGCAFGMKCWFCSSKDDGKARRVS